MKEESRGLGGRSLLCKDSHTLALEQKRPRVRQSLQGCCCKIDRHLGRVSPKPNAHWVPVGPPHPGRLAQTYLSPLLLLHDQVLFATAFLLPSLHRSLHPAPTTSSPRCRRRDSFHRRRCCIPAAEDSQWRPLVVVNCSNPLCSFLVRSASPYLNCHFPRSSPALHL